MSSRKSQATTAALACFAILSTAYVWRCYQTDLEISGSWGCEMSWMMPSYVHIPWSDSPCPAYNLYLYREQGWDTDSTVTGHPVVFVPGNAGSYQQVRSIASSASRQFHGHPGGRATGMETARGLDFFTLDFKEDFSAFHAGTLRRQAQCLASAVDRVLNEYDHLPVDERPSTVTILGHSMGGVVARLALTYNITARVDAIITMSTPHLIPPLLTERDMHAIYREVNVRPRNATSKPLLISLCGGVSDTQIVSDSCALSEAELSADDGFAVFTTGIPGIYTGVDHQAMVWCHQVRWRVARLLLAMEMAGTRAFKLVEARRWLLGDDGRIAHAGQTAQQSDGWISFPVTSSTISVLLKSASISTTGRAPVIQIEHCYGEVCGDVDYVSRQLIPWPFNRSAPFPLVGEGVRPDEMATCLELTLTRSDGELRLHAAADEVISVGQHMIETVHASSWAMASRPHAALALDQRPPTRLSLRFKTFRSSSLIVHRMSIRTSVCTGPRPIIQHHTVPLEDRSRTTQEDRYFTSDHGHVYLHSHSSASPFMKRAARPSSIELEIYQTAQCPVERIDLATSMNDSLAKIVIRYRMAAIAWSLGWTTLIVQHQLAPSDEIAAVTEAIMALWPTTALCVIASVTAIAALQAGCATRMPLHYLLLGTSGAQNVFLAPMIAIWTLSLVAVGLMMLSFTNNTIRRLTPDRASARTFTEGRLGSASLAVLLLLLVHFVIPGQLASVMLFGSQMLGPALSFASPSLQHLSMGLNLVMLFLLPYHLPVVAVWSRHLGQGGYKLSSTDHNILPILPTLALVSLVRSSRDIERHAVARKIVRYLLWSTAIVAFLCGARFTFIIPYLVDVVFVGVCVMLWR